MRHRVDGGPATPRNHLSARVSVRRGKDRSATGSAQSKGGCGRATSLEWMHRRLDRLSGLPHRRRFRARPRARHRTRVRRGRPGVGRGRSQPARARLGRPARNPQVAEILLFHHVNALMSGFFALAFDQLACWSHRAYAQPRRRAHLRQHRRRAGHTSASSASGEVTCRGEQAVVDQLAQTNSSTRASRSGSCPRRSSHRLARARRVRCSSNSCIPMSEFGTSWPKGVPGADSWERMPTRSSSERATSTPLEEYRRAQPRTPSYSSTRATSTISPTRACRRTTRKRLRYLTKRVLAFLDDID